MEFAQPPQHHIIRRMDGGGAINRSYIMSQRQLGWDDMRIRDRVDPSEIVQGEQAQAAQQEATDNMPLDNNNPNDDNWVPPGNSAQGSRKK